MYIYEEERGSVRGNGVRKMVLDGEILGTIVLYHIHLFPHNVNKCLLSTYQGAVAGADTGINQTWFLP